MRLHHLALGLALAVTSCGGAGTGSSAPHPNTGDGDVTQPSSAPRPQPPRARKQPVTMSLHGDERIDDYHWLRNKESAEVIAHLEAENAYTSAVMKPTDAMQAQLYDEMLGRIKQTDDSVPVRDGRYHYYWRTEEGKQYVIKCRKDGSLSAPEEVILDGNELAKGHPFFAIGAFAVSDDGRMLAYTVDTTGFREYKLQVKDLETGKLGPESRERVASVAWAADGKTLLYVTEDEAKRPHQVWRHGLGQDHGRDTLVYEEKDDRFRAGVSRSRSKKYLFIESASHTASETRFLLAARPALAPRLVEPRSDNHEYYVEHRGSRFYIRTNDAGRNFRVVTARVTAPGKAHWKPFLDHDPGRMIESFDPFADHWASREREGGLPHIRIGQWTRTGMRGESARIDMPEPVYTVSEAENPEFGATKFRYSYQSLTTPPTTYEHDIASGRSVVLKETEVLGGYDRHRYQTERIFATATDGTQIPISLVSRKDTPRDGSAPMLLAGYGSYGFSYPVAFSSSRVSLLDRGFVLAYAHIRGGGDMGKKWHDDGRMLNKMNTFTDFIAVAEHLIAARYTSASRLAIQGGSAGGLLMGAVINLRPDLFAAVIADVPFVDVLNTMLDESLPLTVGEFEEWGNPQNAEHYRAMKAYSPYDNIAARAYPTMLVKTSLNDSQVMYWEPAKYVARLRENKTDDNLLLFKINMAGGHGGSSGRYDKLREVAFDYAFLIAHLVDRSL